MDADEWLDADLRAALPKLRKDTLECATELARLPIDIRGFGPIKAAAFEAAAPRRTALLELIAAPKMEMQQAAE